MRYAAALSQRWGAGIGRYSVVLFFLGFGILKFTAPEAAAIHPLLVHSPILFWLPGLFDQQLASDVIGIVEIALAVMMASRPFAPRVSAIGSLGIAASLVTTLSFLVTTPNLDPGLASFIVKDITLLGVALWSAGEAFDATGAQARSGRTVEGDAPIAASLTLSIARDRNVDR